MNKKILMIEDDVELSNLVKASLELSGLAVETCSSMGAAIGKINSEGW
jgi:DNA-binding response OmpR family regulator